MKKLTARSYRILAGKALVEAFNLAAQIYARRGTVEDKAELERARTNLLDFIERNTK